MTTTRSMQVLTAGLKAAHEQMFSDTGLRRPEYPRNFQKIYTSLENNVFALYEAIRDEKFARVRETAADTIVNASKIVEYAEFMERVADMPWNAQEGV